MSNSDPTETKRSIVAKLKSRAVKLVDSPTTPISPAVRGENVNLFALEYGEQEGGRKATTYTVLSGAELDQHLARPLSDEQRSGIAAQIELNR